MQGTYDDAGANEAGAHGRQAGGNTMIQAVLVVNGTRYTVPQQGLRIGRAPENDVVLPDPNVSRQHLVVWATPRGAFLRDLGSQNGTYLSGRRVGAGPEAIPTGAHVRIGVTDIQVEVQQTADAGSGAVPGPSSGAMTIDQPYAGGAGAVGAAGAPYGGGRAAPYGGGPNGNGAAPGYGGAPAYGGAPGARPAAGPYGGPAARPQPARGSTGLIVGGVILVVIVALLAVGALVLKVVADSRATPTPTPTVRPAATSTPPPATPVAAVGTAAPKPGAATATPGAIGKPVAPTAAARPTTAPVEQSKPTAAPVEQPKPSGGRDPNFVRALNAAVRVIVPTGATSASLGSGSIISAKGHILTNYHVVSDDNGKLINQGNGVIIAVPPNEGDPAKPKYRAKVIDFDVDRDLAILQLVALSDGSTLPSNLGLNPIPIGTSASVNIGDTIVIIGFPDPGGSTLTVTRGIDSGIAPPNTFSGDKFPYIKTDTEINHGNSGGTAINAAGELIGVPTAGWFDKEKTGKIGLVRPIDVAKDLIARAVK
jgi:S1-C subfamily serine protease